jgi:NitT/TauT family transport system permease protein
MILTESRVPVADPRQEALDAMRVMTAEEEAQKRHAARRTRIAQRVACLLFGLVLLGYWEWAAQTGRIHDLIAPAPSEIVRHIPTLVTAEYFMRNLKVTLIELAIGFSLGIAAGVLLGTAVSVSSFTKAVIQPYIIALQAPPKVLLAPLFVTWFGFGMASKIVMAVVISFFPLFVNTVAGLTAVNPEAERLMRSLTASRRQMFFKVLLPNALPLIFAGLKLCWTLAVIGVVVAEFIGASAGIGYLIQSFNFQLDMLGVFSLIILLSASTVAVFWLLETLERKLVFWDRL